MICGGNEEELKVAEKLDVCKRLFNVAYNICKKIEILMTDEKLLKPILKTKKLEKTKLML